MRRRSFTVPVPFLPSGRLQAIAALVVGAALALSGCGDDPSGPGKSGTVATVQISHGGTTPADASLGAIGDTIHLTARALDRNGNVITGSSFTWSSSDEAIATVASSASGRGEVSAVAPGTVTIRATTGSVSGSAAVAVEQVVTEVTLEPAELTLPGVGESADLEAVARDRNGHAVAGRSFEWSSSDDSKATVDESGQVTALAPGSITVTASAGEVDGSATVHIVQEVARIEVTPESESLPVGETVQLSARAFDAGDQEVADVDFTWSTSDADVATVSDAGLVTTVSEGGPVTITASAAGESGTASITATRAAVATVTLSPRSFTLSAGETRQLSAILTDAAANRLTGREVAWSSDNEAIATVSSSGLVKALKNGGPVTITATSEGKSGTSTVSVLTIQPPAERTMAPGGDFTCALTSTGQPYCWGRNSEGQLGNGTLIDSKHPSAVSGGHTFDMISSGPSHACGLKEDGRVYCWGQNDFSQLGDGTMTDRTVPTAVTGGLTFTTISSGSGHTCALRADGKAYCWGDNSEGQLGDGTEATRTTPTAVLGDLVFREISAGYGYTCGVTTTYIGYCWGYNAAGQLGDGGVANRNVPSRIAASLDVRSVYAGANFTCALTVRDESYCWGRNADGQLGDGTTAASNTPVAVAGSLTFRSMNLGVDHSCALTFDGAAYCWGQNNGLLGNGDTDNSARPVAVTGGHTFETLGVGRQHTCAVTAAGDAYCWGVNSNGQLGDGTTTTRSSPVAVTGTQVFARYAASGWPR